MDIQRVIKEVEDSSFNAPRIFSSLLNKKDAFTADCEILGAVYFSREYYSDQKQPPNISFRAKLLLATSQGVLYTEEGIDKICEDNCGYNFKYIPFHKITYLEMDVCMLLGILKISSGSGSESEINFRFGTAQYQDAILEFVDVVRNQLKG